MVVVGRAQPPPPPPAELPIPPPPTHPPADPPPPNSSLQVFLADSWGSVASGPVVVAPPGCLPNLRNFGPITAFLTRTAPRPILIARASSPPTTPHFLWFSAFELPNRMLRHPNQVMVAPATVHGAQTNQQLSPPTNPLPGGLWDGFAVLPTAADFGILGFNKATS